MRAEIWLEIEEAERDPPERAVREYVSQGLEVETSQSLPVLLRMTWKSGDSTSSQLEPKKRSPTCRLTDVDRLRGDGSGDGSAATISGPQSSNPGFQVGDKGSPIRENRVSWRSAPRRRALLTQLSRRQRRRRRRFHSDGGRKPPSIGVHQCWGRRERSRGGRKRRRVWRRSAWWRGRPPESCEEGREEERAVHTPSIHHPTEPSSAIMRSSESC